MSLRRSTCVLGVLLAAAFAGNLFGQVTLGALNRSGAYAGQPVALTVTGLASTVTSVSVTITPPAGNGSPVTFPSTAVTAATPPTNRTVRFVVPASLASSNDIPNCSLTISGQMNGSPFTSSNSVSFTILALPVISVVSPGAGQVGTVSTPATVDVQIAGKHTNFSSASVPSISGADTAVTIQPKTWDPSQGDDATHLRATITIPNNAVAGARTITVKTGSETATLAGAFVVTASPALSFSSISPATCAQGATLPVTVTGINTHFSQGVTTGNFGDGVSIGAITVVSPTQATVQVSCDSLARPGGRTVTIVTGASSRWGRTPSR